MSVLQWEDPRVQKFIEFHLSRWYSFLGGYLDRDDIKQELAVEFVKLQSKLDPSLGERSAMAMFRQRSRWCIATLHRRVIRRRFSDTVAFDEHYPFDEGQVDFDFNYLESAVEESDGTVYAFLSGWLKGEGRRKMETIDACCRRLTGQSWRKIRPLVIRWADASVVGV